MDNQDDSENNAKVSDSAYSNSCSNSQSRRSHSSKSTHSGSHSSRSSGYGGKPSTFSDNSGQANEKRSKEKDSKQKKLAHLEKTTETLEDEVIEKPSEHAPDPSGVQEEKISVEHMPSPQQAKAEIVIETLDIVATAEKPCIIEEINHSKLEVMTVPVPLNTATTLATTRSPPSAEVGFSCVISMHDGVVMYTTSSLTATLGFPKDMWIGRSFIDFVDSRDRNIFASHITSGLAVPKNVNGTLNEVPSLQNSACTMVCRIRKYRNLTHGFGVKERTVGFLPFLLKLSFKNISDEEGKVIYLVIQATPFFSAFKTPNELVKKAIPFVIRHAADGIMKYIDPEAVPYLGFLPQDLEGKNALQLYHIEDLPYLRQVYETIVKEGGVPRSKPFRMMTQNWDFIKVETEWSSFINPWSKKLEFVTGKHCIIEGPTNPDVFHIPKNEKPAKLNEEEIKKAQALRDSIIRIMNEVLTKPAEVAKQQMSKRCQDLASFMESLIEEHPVKTDDALHLEIQDPDSYYERDSEMLGGISPHHEHNDSKSSVETPLSYNQLNYNETLQRYFDSHQPYSYEEYNTVAGENILGLKILKSVKGTISSVAQTSGISGEISSCESGTSIGANSPIAPSGKSAHIRLTEILINKHNAEMEKELMKSHRETRSSSKGERKKTVNENKQKKKEHLERCNATFQPTSVANNPIEQQPHGVKRSSKQIDTEAGTHKHHCPTPRQSKKKQITSAGSAMPSSTITTTVAQSAAAHHCQDSNANGMNGFFLGVGFPQQMSIMNPMGAMPAMPAGMIPMYYAPTTTAMSDRTDLGIMAPSNPQTQFQQPMQCMMYGQAVYGSPFMYSAVNPQMTYPQSMQSVQTAPLGLAYSNYEEACKQSLLQTQSHGNRDKWNRIALFPSGWDTSVGASANNSWRKKQLKSQTCPSKRDKISNGSHFSSSNSFNRSGENSDSQGTADMKLCSTGTHTSPDSSGAMSTDAMQNSNPSSGGKHKGSAEDTIDRTDGESSYSSFYSSFFKTEASGSAEEFEAKKVERALGTTNTYYEPPSVKTIAKRKIDPPWTEQVCVTSELIYKYQILTRDVDEVLKADKMKMDAIEQPALVNEQLGQLYLDLQLEGEAAKLTLDEGITSSSSSEEESSVPEKTRRKRDYNKLVMFYEEDAPLPPTPEMSPTPEATTSTD